MAMINEDGQMTKVSKNRIYDITLGRLKKTEEKKTCPLYEEQGYGMLNGVCSLTDEDCVLKGKLGDDYCKQQKMENSVIIDLAKDREIAYKKLQSEDQNKA